jgi:hypothetical protein
MSSNIKQLETCATFIAKVLSRQSKEENLGIREYIRWMVDHENKQIAFMGQDSIGSHPTYYSYPLIRYIANDNEQLKEALSHLSALGYEIIRWCDNDDIEGRNNDLDFDVNEYRKLLITFPPIVINNQKEADKVSRFIDKMNADTQAREEEEDYDYDYYFLSARYAYCSLLKFLLRDWELKQSKEGKSFTPEPPKDIASLSLDDIPF